MKSFLTLLICLLSYPLCAQIELAPNPNFGTIDVVEDTVNLELFDNFGTINVQDTLTSFDLLFNHEHLNVDGVFDNQYLVFNSGALNNQGLYSNNAGTAIFNSGVVTNGGQFFAGSFNNEDTGVVINSGTLDIRLTDNCSNYGVINNSGTITNTGFFSNDAVINNTNLFTNNSYFLHTGDFVGNLTNNGYMECLGTYTGQFNTPGEVYIDSNGYVVNGGMQMTPTSSLELYNPNINFSALLTVTGNLNIGGTVFVVYTPPHTLTDIPVINIGGVRTGFFSNQPQNSVMYQSANSSRYLDYYGGDGNDVVLSRWSRHMPIEVKVGDGQTLSGDVTSIQYSDDIYHTLEPETTVNPLKQIINYIMQTALPSNNIKTLRFTSEIKMLGGDSGSVIQQTYLFNYKTHKWELLDTRAVAVTDTKTTITVMGDLTRFIGQLEEVTARVQIASPTFSGTPFWWTVDIDRMMWEYDDLIINNLNRDRGR